MVTTEGSASYTGEGPTQTQRLSDQDGGIGGGHGAQLLGVWGIFHMCNHYVFIIMIMRLVNTR